jgi:hypothetical protein
MNYGRLGNVIIFKKFRGKELLVLIRFKLLMLIPAAIHFGGHSMGGG